MANSPSTRPSLLVRLRDAQDGLAWSQFVELYAPLIYGFVRKQRLQDADAADLTQDVLRAVSVAIKRLDYDPRQGTFRGWLFTVVRNKLRNFLASRQRLVRGSGDSDMHRLLQEQPAPQDDEAALWQEEYQRRVFAWAASQVRDDFQESSWQAFWMTAVEGKSGKETAHALGLTVAAVYLAKSRIMARIKEQIEELHEE
jgi:RNA polymerase sigma-70 factor (ECF subfamily)